MTTGKVIWTKSEICAIMRSLDLINERHRTDENKETSDAYHDALVDVGVALKIIPEQSTIWIAAKNDT